MNGNGKDFQLTPTDFKTYCSISSSVALDRRPTNSLTRELKGGFDAICNKVFTPRIIICLSVSNSHIGPRGAVLIHLLTKRVRKIARINCWRDGWICARYMLVFRLDTRCSTMGSNITHNRSMAKKPLWGIEHHLCR
jgi:hypothetical protein